MRRAVVFVAVIVTALLLQTTVFPELTLLGIKPELLYLVTVVFAALRGPAEGAPSASSAGSRRTSCSTCRWGSPRSR